MTEPQKAMIKTILVILLGVAALVFALKSEAAPPWHTHGGTTDVVEVTDISYYSSSSLSDDDIADIVSGSIAGGSHQFSPLTTRWQISATGATSTSDFDEDTNFSFAVAKRFGKDHWMPNALWHASFTPDIQDNDYVAIGATVLLDE